VSTAPSSWRTRIRMNGKVLTRLCQGERCWNIDDRALGYKTRERRWCCLEAALEHLRAAILTMAFVNALLRIATAGHRSIIWRLVRLEQVVERCWTRERTHEQPQRRRLAADYQILSDNDGTWIAWRTTRDRRTSLAGEIKAGRITTFTMVEAAILHGHCD
jgi:hypothetical protein